MRLIDADELETRIKKLKSQIASRAAGFVDEDSYECGAVDALYDALTYLHEVETVYAVPVVHGRWVGYPECLQYINAYSDDHIICSACEECFSIIDNCAERFDYCPHCGAKMDGGEADDH